MGGHNGGEGVHHLLQVLTMPAPVLPSELLPASFISLIIIPLVNLVFLLPFFIAGPGWVKGTCGDSPLLDSPSRTQTSVPTQATALAGDGSLGAVDGSPGAGDDATQLPTGPAPLPLAPSPRHSTRRQDTGCSCRSC